SPASPAGRASCSDACRSHASTTASRIAACKDWIGSNRRPASVIAIAAPSPPPHHAAVPSRRPFAAVFVVNRRDGLQLRRLFLGRRVVEKISAADFGSGEILEQARLAE